MSLWPDDAEDLPRVWRDRRRDAEEELERRLAQGAARHCPTNLAELAHACHAKLPEFRRLLEPAGLTLDRGDFVVYVDCEKARQSEYQASFGNPSDAGRSLPVDIRFTIAHELAHTLFFEAREKGEWKSIVNTSSYAEWEKLEKECNRLA